MTVACMRALDRWLGVPLCGLCSLVCRAAPRADVPPRRILLIELSEMGSAILADPAMRQIQTHLPEAELFFAIFEHNRPSLGLLGTVPPERIFGLRGDTLRHLGRDTARFRRWARRHGIDTVIDLELFSRFTALLAVISGAANRVGFDAFHEEGLYRGRLLTRRVIFNPLQHIAANFLALAYAVIYPQDEEPYTKRVLHPEALRLARARPTERQREQARAAVRQALPDFDGQRHRLLLVNPDFSEWIPQRRWPAARYAGVIAALLARHADLRVLVTGGREEQAGIRQLAGQVDDARCAAFAGALPLDALPALYGLTTVMLTGDSGPAHFAAVTDLPTYVIFGPETPRLYGALGNTRFIYAGFACSPCVRASNHRRSPCRDNRCLQAITVDEVVARVREVLG